MRLTCISRFRAEGPDGVLHEYNAGQDVNVPDSQAAYLLRISPASFENPAKVAKARAKKVKAEAPDEADVVADNAMSTTTQTGLTAPDRRARGGRVRRPSK